jgi:hypothetical protein
VQNLWNALSLWTTDQIDAACAASHRIYERELQKRYTEYFSNYPQLRCPVHPYSARTLTTALPAGSAHLLHRIPKGSLHRFARSARSSQMLALSLIGSAAQADPSLRWFWGALNLPKEFSGRQTPSIRFEHCLAPSDLGEVPRVTKLDLTVATERAFVVIETKWSEAGMGICSCAREGDGDPRIGFDCAVRVRSRRMYWKIAHQFLGLEAVRLSFMPCTLCPVYQTVRNIAAAIHLSRDRTAGFVLIYDRCNPYFRQTNRWPGWPHILRENLRKHRPSGFFFRATSWQELIHHLPVPASLRRWATEKHAL